jgi:hypothetical protein
MKFQHHLQVSSKRLFHSNTKAFPLVSLNINILYWRFESYFMIGRLYIQPLLQKYEEYYFFLKLFFGGKKIHVFKFIHVNNSQNKRNQFHHCALLQFKGTQIRNFLLVSEYSLTLQTRFTTPLGSWITGHQETFLRKQNMYLSHDRVLTDFPLERMGRLRVTLNPLRTCLIGTSEASLS